MAKFLCEILGLIMDKEFCEYLTLVFLGFSLLVPEPRGFSRVAAGFSSYDGEFRMPLVLVQGSPIFHSSCEGKLGIALE